MRHLLRVALLVTAVGPVGLAGQVPVVARVEAASTSIPGSGGFDRVTGIAFGGGLDFAPALGIFVMKRQGTLSCSLQFCSSGIDFQTDLLTAGLQVRPLVGQRIRPFIEGGWTYTEVQQLGEDPNGRDVSFVSDGRGLVLGGGVDFQVASHVRIGPSLTWTRTRTELVPVVTHGVARGDAFGVLGDDVFQDGRIVIKTMHLGIRVVVGGR